MAEIIINNPEANFEEDTDKFRSADRVCDIGYWKGDDSFHFFMYIDKDDHSITFDLDRKQLLSLLEEALVNPEE